MWSHRCSLKKHDSSRILMFLCTKVSAINQLMKRCTAIITYSKSDSNPESRYNICAAGWAQFSKKSIHVLFNNCWCHKILASLYQTRKRGSHVSTYFQSSCQRVLVSTRSALDFPRFKIFFKIRRPSSWTFGALSHAKIFHLDIPNLHLQLL